MRLSDFSTESHALSFRAATLADVPVLMQIGHSWTEKEVTEGDAFKEEELIESITHGSLPPIPSANEANFGLYVIEKVIGNETQASERLPIGLLELYKGYPDENTLWIGLFIISAEYRRNHYGMEAIDAVKEFAPTLNCTHLGIGVSLKNWRGLRFWHAMGFKEIFKISSDVDYTPEGHAVLALTQELT